METLKEYQEELILNYIMECVGNLRLYKEITLKFTLEQNNN